MDNKSIILTWPSPAKLNLFLYIIGYNINDNYHELQTLFQLLNYGDKITIKSRVDNKIRLLNKFDNLSSKNNLIIKAAYLLREYCNKLHYNNYYNGADIYIHKFLPFGSGLGGGSSNAATTLIALNYHWKTNIDDNVLAKLAENLGADVPLFVKGYSSFAEGIGYKLIPMQLPKKWYVIIYPGFLISTKNIFHDPFLKRNSPKRSLNTLLNIPYTNDCELTVKQRFPKIKELILWLSKYKSFRLTGTGSCIFAEFESKELAFNILKQIPKYLYSFMASGVNYSPLHIFRNKNH